MLFCKKCQVEHEEDKRFCPQCGSFLIRKEVFLSEAEETGKPEEDKPKEKFICPVCKIIYEKTKKCIRCGAEVILLMPPHPNEPPGEVETSVTQEQPSPFVNTKNELDIPPEPLICPACKKEHLGGKSCMRCGTALVPHEVLQEKAKAPSSPPLADKKGEKRLPPLTEIEKQLFQEESPDQPPRKKSVQEQIQQGRLLRKVKKDYPRMALNWSGMGIICMAVGYLLWSTYIHIVPSKSKLEDVSNHKPSSSVSTTSETSTYTEAIHEEEEKERVKDLLEKIRKANLEKDIHLFLFCYAKDYKDREGKKKSTLEMWENFNFLDLSFNLESFALMGNVARSRVDWFARFTPKGGSVPQQSQTSLEVVFKKEDGHWKIAEIK